MSKDSIKIGNILVKYGVTPVSKLLGAGYTISDFNQIIEEPTLATCNLNKNDKTVAILSFFDLKEPTTIDQLADTPIDLLLPYGAKRSRKAKTLSQKKALIIKIAWTLFIHFAATSFFYCVYSIPALFSWVQKTKFRAMGGIAPIGMVLLVLPALLITFLWGGTAITQNKIAEKILLSIWLIFNVIVSTAYLVLIDNLFTGRFF